MNNSYENFLIEILDMINPYRNKDICTSSYLYSVDSSILDRFLYNKIKLDQKIINKYQDLDPRNESNIMNRLQLLSDFISYIRFIEKCYMYNNSDNNNLYSEIKKDGTKILYFVTDNYKSRIMFEKTNIVNLGMVNEDPLSGQSYLEIINIEIIRLFGKQMNNTFKFVTGEFPQFSDRSDNILFNNFIEEISLEVYRVFKQSIDNAIPDNMKIVGGAVQSFFIEEAISDGIYVSKRDSKQRKINRDSYC